MQDKYKQYKEEMERILKVDKSFDLIRRRMKSKSGRSMTFFYIDGFTKDMVMQKMMEYFIKVETVEDLTVNIPYVEIELTDDIDTAVAINEAVELAKKYASDDDKAYINGVLGAISRDLQK